jgi:hypothetical protein
VWTRLQLMDSAAVQETLPNRSSPRTPDAPWSSLPTPVLELLCAFLPTGDIKGLKLVCASFARRIGSSHAVRERLMARKLAWERQMEPGRKEARAAWRAYADQQRQMQGGSSSGDCRML